MAENQIRRQPANCNSPPADFRLVEIEVARGPKSEALVHVSVPVRRVLARYRARIGNGEALTLASRSNANAPGTHGGTGRAPLTHSHGLSGLQGGRA